MVLTDTQVYSYIQRVVQARNRVLEQIPCFESILISIKFNIDEGCGTACANSKCIRFSPAFLDNLTESELEFVMIHEILHIVLDHPKLAYIERRAGGNIKIFNFACDVVVNSIILEIYNHDISRITLNIYGESVHTAPNGKEGRCYTAEEVYEMLINDKMQKCA